MALRPVIAWLITGSVALIAIPAPAADISGFRVWTDPEKTRAVLDLDARAEYQVFTLDNPPRVVVDVQQAQLGTALNLVEEYSGVIDGVRHGQPSADTLRIVLDLQKNSTVKSFMLDPTSEYGHRLVIDLFPERILTAGEVVKQMTDLQSPNRDVVIAIDAGHGGEDPGAIGKNRTREKDVVLAIARELKKTLDARPGLSALLVREGDYYVPHRDRFEFARKSRADLFVSIHADAFTRRDVAGSSVFILSRKGASSEFARRLADSENSADLVGGVTLSDKDDMLASVLLDLSQSATMQASRAVADSVFSALHGVGKTHRNQVEYANFMVLKSPDVPAILVETWVISNPSEEQRLRDPAWQSKLAQVIGDGVQDYFFLSPPPGTWIAANRQRIRHRVVNGDTLGVSYLLESVA